MERPDPPARMLDRRDEERLQAALADAQRLLGLERPAEGGAEELTDLIAALEGAVEAEADAAERTAHKEGLERLRQRFGRRREAISRIEASVDRLREVTSPPAIIEAAAQRLCEGSEMERAIVSTVDRGAMAVAAAHVEGDPEGASRLLAELSEEPIRLEHPLLEAEVLRRRRATVVADARLNPRVSTRLNEVTGWSAYVVAPVVARGRVMAVVHADRRDEAPDSVDRDAVWRFAVGFAHAYESASLRRGLRQERDQMRRFLDRLNARLGELSDSAIELAPWGPPEPEEERRGPSHEGGAVFGGLLTRREVDVVELMAEGLGNRQIAARLVISEGTVKFHVNGVLRKLRAANRAEAVSRYLARAR